MLILYDKGGRKMFGRNKNKAVNSKPMKLDRTLYKVIGSEWDKIPQSESDHWVKYMAVMRPQKEGGDVCDVRVFDEWSAQQNKISILNYGSLDNQPDMILFEGWFDRKSKKGDIKYKAVAKKAA